MSYDWNFRIVLLNTDLWLSGAGWTLLMAAGSLAIAVPLGLIWTVLRLYAPRPIRRLVIFIIEFLRVSAPVVLIIWAFFALPLISGVNIDTFSAGTLAIGIQGSAFFAEIIRSGIKAVDPGQAEAARAIGMKTAAMMRFIILPQALRHMLPVMLLMVAEVIKITSLAAIITYGELAYAAGRVASDTFRPVEAYTVVAMIYFAIIFVVSQLAAYFERRLSRRLSA